MKRRFRPQVQQLPHSARSSAPGEQALPQDEPTSEKVTLVSVARRVLNWPWKRIAGFATAIRKRRVRWRMLAPARALGPASALARQLAPRGAGEGTDSRQVQPSARLQTGPEVGSAADACVPAKCRLPRPRLTPDPAVVLQWGCEFDAKTASIDSASGDGNCRPP